MFYAVQGNHCNALIDTMNFPSKHLFVPVKHIPLQENTKQKEKNEIKLN